MTIASNILYLYLCLGFITPSHFPGAKVIRRLEARVKNSGSTWTAQGCDAFPWKRWSPASGTCQWSTTGSGFSHGSGTWVRVETYGPNVFGDEHPVNETLFFGFTRVPGFWPIARWARVKSHKACRKKLEKPWNRMEYIFSWGYQGDEASVPEIQRVDRRLQRFFPKDFVAPEGGESAQSSTLRFADQVSGRWFYGTSYSKHVKTGFHTWVSATHWFLPFLEMRSLSKSYGEVPVFKLAEAPRSFFLFSQSVGPVPQNVNCHNQRTQSAQSAPGP